MHTAVLPDCGPFLPIRAVISRKHSAAVDFSSPGGSPHRISFIPPDSACEYISQTAEQGQRPGSEKKSLFILYPALLPDDSLFRCNDFFKADESTSKIVFYSETALFFLCAIIRTMQFLKSVCSNLRTFCIFAPLKLCRPLF